MPDDDEKPKDDIAGDHADAENRGQGISGGKVVLIVLMAFCLSIGVSSGIAFVMFKSMLPKGGTDVVSSVKVTGRKVGLDSSASELSVSFGEEGVIFIKLKPLSIDLVSLGQETRFLRLVVVLEVHGGEAEVTIVKKNLMRIHDVLYTYLRGLYVGSFRGISGAERLREQLLVRINRILVPIMVDNILFDELMIE